MAILKIIKRLLKKSYPYVLHKDMIHKDKIIGMINRRYSEDQSLSNHQSMCHLH